MGTWDIGHFDNDTAADFCGGLDEAAASEREGLVRRALTLAADTVAEDYLDCDEAVKALAAAALVASQCPDGAPVTTAYGPDEPLPVFAADLRPLAVAALDRVVAEESELAELWDETEDGPAWRRAVQELRDVLAPAGGPAPEALFELT
ncbi:DUF4259 domain-containing protein [Kitasatospora purpeofusca]|uniref:DUF4259 domain-containing protein n=1 Tax=Kitasatospora purpeofusca TaxID=67352 RepID=UPI002A5A0767|nr:DUF4259 domain-containing protein [Kitasatospora purpeofusca]MDY0813749.1 DUF4259 domain-containing protein [Kitasatospora purpeofusca]